MMRNFQLRGVFIRKKFSNDVIFEIVQNKFLSIKTKNKNPREKSIINLFKRKSNLSKDVDSDLIVFSQKLGGNKKQVKK